MQKITKTNVFRENAFAESFSQRYQKAPCVTALQAKDMNVAWCVLAKIGEAVLRDFNKNLHEAGRNSFPCFETQGVSSSASALYPQHVHSPVRARLRQFLRMPKEINIKQILRSQAGLTNQSLTDAGVLVEKIVFFCQLSARDIGIPFSGMNSSDR